MSGGAGWGVDSGREFGWELRIEREEVREGRWWTVLFGFGYGVIWHDLTVGSGEDGMKCIGMEFR